MMKEEEKIALLIDNWIYVNPEDQEIANNRYHTRILLFICIFSLVFLLYFSMLLHEKQKHLA
ncbi:DUF2157 domain-containing protein [Caenorhabditis elegans]|uniref:DUF2157 domain-containing protein n=1 Tax=Caenorhabditis elegans TaxID=6239 RepID=I2HAF2_CAEEL|nr:DUF2157 domain-containing protein [Caenorhabditis elegans]CCH63859.2 DUF2157 domain-containing protein [Caenorhabditis elegans]|eukprot:NP_001255288.2 Uncharacterized protein CELE_ZK381.62 [Caenorhabditis elegans]